MVKSTYIPSPIGKQMSDWVGIYPTVTSTISRTDLDAKVKALSDSRIALSKHFETREQCRSRRGNRPNFKNKNTEQCLEVADKCSTLNEFVEGMNGMGRSWTWNFQNLKG